MSSARGATPKDRRPGCARCAPRLEEAYPAADRVASFGFTQGDELQGLLATTADPFRAVLLGALHEGCTPDALVDRARRGRARDRAGHGTGRGRVHPGPRGARHGEAPPRGDRHLDRRARRRPAPRRPRPAPGRAPRRADAEPGTDRPADAHRGPAPGGRRGLARRQPGDRERRARARAHPLHRPTSRCATRHHGRSTARPRRSAAHRPKPPKGPDDRRSDAHPRPDRLRPPRLGLRHPDRPDRDREVRHGPTRLASGSASTSSGSASCSSRSSSRSAPGPRVPRRRDIRPRDHRPLEDRLDAPGRGPGIGRSAGGPCGLDPGRGSRLRLDGQAGGAVRPRPGRPPRRHRVGMGPVPAGRAR